MSTYLRFNELENERLCPAANTAFLVLLYKLRLVLPEEASGGVIDANR